MRPDSQKRTCFVCQGATGDILFSENWLIAGCDTVNVGIRICAECGMVLQDPVVPHSVMSRWYSLMGNYANPSRDGCPASSKIDAVNRQLEYLRRFTAQTGRAFQVGCSDGYTLSRIRQEGWEVSGVDPSEKATALARSLYGLEIHVGFFETYETNHLDKYDLIILTHVLEHLYDPISALDKCRRMLAPGGLILVEVPALVYPDQWSISFFTFEHLNYFSPSTLANSLNMSGLEICADIEVIGGQTDYPVMLCVAKVRKTSHLGRVDTVYSESSRDCMKFMTRISKMWYDIDAHLITSLRRVSRTVIWAAGIHTSQLLAHTNLENYTTIVGIVDSDSQKWGLKLGAYTVTEPNSIDFADPSLAIVISSFDSEGEIYDYIKSQPLLKSEIIRLHER